MLAFMRKALKGWAGKTLLILFVSPFLFFGASSIFTAFNNIPGPVEINGEVITDAQISNAVERNKEQIRRRFGKQFDMSLLSDEALKEGAMGQLIEEELSKKYSDDNNLGASFSSVSEVIRNIPSFFDENGKFSQEVFETVAARQGLSTKQIIKLIGDDIRNSQPQQGIKTSTFGLPSEIRMLDSLKNQQRDTAYILLKNDDFQAKVEVSDTDIENFYNDNLNSFMTEELVSIDYIELKASDFEAGITISEDEILARFESEQEAINQNAQRKASHILITVDENRNESEAYKIAEDVKQQLSDGKSFAELAKNYSEDPGSAKQGGDLGFAGRGAYVPEFENALYSLNVGEISEPVLTEFGYHIIKLTEIDKSEALDLETDRERIATLLKAESARKIYQEKISSIEEVLYESPDLTEPSLRAGLQIKESTLFSINSGEGIAENQDVRNLAFSNDVLIEQENSSVVELDSGHAIVIRVKEHQLPEVKPLDAVKDDIVQSIKSEKATENMNALKEDIIQKLASGASRSEVDTSMDLDWIVKEKIERQESDIPGEILVELFKMPRPTEGENSVSSVEVGENNLAIIQLINVIDNDSTLDDEKLRTQVRQASYQNAPIDWGNHMANLKGNAKIIYKQNQK